MSIVSGRRVVVTGKVAGESRQTAEQKLREAGAIVQSAVGKDTDVLVTGAAVGATKTNKARELGVDVIPWEQAFSEQVAKCPECGSEVIDDDGAGLKVSCSTCEWEGTYAEAGNYVPLPPVRAPLPKVRQWAPMLCSPATEIPTDDGWIFEIKWDGQRGIATVKDGSVAIQSRTGKTDLTERYPYVTNDLEKLEDCVLDGELVDIGSGTQLLVFDCLEVNGVDIGSESLDERRRAIRRLIADANHPANIALSTSFEDGENLLKWVAENNHEGVVAKKRTAPYVEGSRGPAWLKVKVRREQEFVIAGYTPGEGARESTFGALILGYYNNGYLTHAGKVGTGFDAAKLKSLSALMKPLEIPESHVGFPKEKGAIYLKPDLVCQVAFQKWTEDAILWHPSFQRLRDDKLAADVVRET